MIGHVKGRHNRFHENVMLIFLKEAAANIKVAGIKKRQCEIQLDEMCCWADEMDSLWPLKIMSFTQSA